MKPRSERQDRGSWLTPLVLFVLTCFTTTWAGAYQVHPEISWWRLGEAIPLLHSGLPFSLSLMAILVSHEMGHYVAARWHGIRVTLPIFVPLPFGWIGTFGAIIGMPPTLRDRDALADVGAAGPIAGLCVAVPLLAYGLTLSPVNAIVEGGLVEGNSLLYLGLKLALKGAILPGGGKDVFLHPIALAGWVGLLITMINLMPVGQLDGGHIAHAYFGDTHDRVALWLHRGLLLLAGAVSLYVGVDAAGRAGGEQVLGRAVMAGMPWAVWWSLLALMRRLTGGRYHPPVGDAPLSRKRRWLCQAMLWVFILIFTPIPLRVG